MKRIWQKKEKILLKQNYSITIHLVEFEIGKKVFSLFYEHINPEKRLGNDRNLNGSHLLNI